LQKGYLDIAFQADLVRLESIRNLELAKYPMRWIVAANSPYNRPFSSLQELASERLITFVANSRPHQDILSLLHLNGITSPRISCVNSFAAMTRLIEDGFGIGINIFGFFKLTLRQAFCRIIFKCRPNFKNGNMCLVFLFCQSVHCNKRN
jgi:DNA-binding transcriptional LysR family regulator